MICDFKHKQIGVSTRIIQNTVMDKCQWKPVASLIDLLDGGSDIDPEITKTLKFIILSL